jgi:glycosyltransferase involved in cell wall biosynthesis
MILRRHPDVIYLLGAFPPHALSVITSHRILKIPLILDLDDWELKYNTLLNTVVSGIQDYLLKNSRFVVVASHELMRFVLRKGVSGVCYIPTGVDTQLFYPRKRKTEKKILVFTGSRIVQHLDNIRLMLDALRIVAKQIKDFEVWMAGTSDSVVDAFIRRNFPQGPKLKLLGPISYTKLPYFLSNGYMGLHPLVDTYYNRCKCPTKVFEFMAVGLPVVSSRVGEVGFIISHNKDGLLATSPAEFAEHILTLLRNEDFAVKLGKKARRTVEKKFSLQVLVQKLHRVLREVVAED